MIKYKRLNYGLLLLSIFFFTFMIACDSGDSNRETNPDVPPPMAPMVGDDDDDFMDDTDPPEGGSGVIRGSVVSSTGTPLNGVHVRAVNLDDTDLQLSSFSGIDSDLQLDDGEFSIQNVPPGTYRVLIEKMNNRNSAFDPSRYSPFVIEATALEFPDEYWNGADESGSDNPSDFTSIAVTNGSTVNGIDIITND